MTRLRPMTWRWTDSPEPLHRLLDGGGIVGYPTESSYALGADPTNERGVEAVFVAKRRDPDKPLPVVLGQLEQLRRLGGDPGQAVLRRLEKLWPAPLTAVVPIDSPIPATRGGSWLAIRIPAHQKLRDLLLRLDRPLTSTSANPSGEEPVTDPEMLAPMLATRPSLIIDDGDLPGGEPSTIVKMESDAVVVLRHGAYPVDGLGDALLMPVFSAVSAEIPADDSWQAR